MLIGQKKNNRAFIRVVSFFNLIILIGSFQLGFAATASKSTSSNSKTSATYSKSYSATKSSAAGYTSMAQSLGKDYSYSAVSTYSSSQGWGYSVQKNEPYKSDSSNGNSSSGNTNPGGSLYFPGFTMPANGYFDTVTPSTCSVAGWAYDPDSAATPIAVHVYQDGPAGVGKFVTSCQANQSRPDVNAIVKIPGNHGFNCVLPASFVNTGNHTLFIHAIDINNTPNNLLRTNGKALNCNGVITPPPSGPSGPSSPGGPIAPVIPATPGTIKVTVQSSVVRKLNTTNVRWQISNPIPPTYTCTLNGPGMVNIPITTQNGSLITKPIDSSSIFTVRCSNGVTPISGEAKVEIIPTVQEV